LVVRDDFWVQDQLGDLYVPSFFMDYPSDHAQARAFNRVERAVERWPDLLAGVVWDPATERIVIKATPAGVNRAGKIAARCAEAGITEAIVVEQVPYSESALHGLHMKVIEGNYVWLGPHTAGVTGSVADIRINAVLVEMEVPLSEDAVALTRARWGRDVRLRFAPGSRMIEQ
jgi:hypothetical protein